MVLALIFALLSSIATLIGRSFGLGKHIWNLSPNLLDVASDIGPITKSLYGSYLAYSTSITFTKLSIIATYVRIFPNGPLRYSIFGIGVVVIIFWITSVFCIIFTCVPVEAAWDYTIKNAKCIHILDYFYTSAGVNIATDLLLCFLPLPTIWKLQMPKAQRVVVCIIFGMGTLYAHLCHFYLDLKLTSLSACAATVLRLTQLNHLDGIDVPCQPPHSHSSYQLTKTTDQSAGSLNWSVIEVGTGILCASISSLRPLATRYLPSFFSHFTAHSSDLPSLRYNNASVITSKVSKAGPQNNTQRSMTESSIYVERSFDVTEMVMMEESDSRTRKSSERKEPEVWTAPSRQSSQEVLVRETTPGTAV
jgi:hypothetical protein